MRHEGVESYVDGSLFLNNGGHYHFGLKPLSVLIAEKTNVYS